MLTVYFDFVHCWFPILSKKRLFQDYQAKSPGLSLLLLCMKLVITPTDEPEAMDIYIAVKHYVVLLEISRNVSLRLLQSMILISLYEQAHAIFPAGYLTVGYMARLGIMMGLHSRKNAAQLMQPAATWTLREEERRAWWAVLIMDR